MHVHPTFEIIVIPHGVGMRWCVSVVGSRPHVGRGSGWQRQGEAFKRRIRQRPTILPERDGESHREDGYGGGFGDGQVDQYMQPYNRELVQIKSTIFMYMKVSLFLLLRDSAFPRKHVTF